VLGLVALPALGVSWFVFVVLVENPWSAQGSALSRGAHTDPSSADGFSARLARFMATLGSSQGPSSRSPSRNNRPELGVDLGRGVEHRSDVRFEYDRDDWPCDVSRKSVRFRLGIVEFVLAAHSVCVRWRIFLG